MALGHGAEVEVKENKTRPALATPESDPLTKKRLPQYQYTYIDRDHTSAENWRHIGIIYGVSWILYPATQPSVFFDQGSFRNYRRNFGHLVFDKDEPFWNWLVHPFSGSQLYLYYRANGYRRIDAMAMTFVSSTLFEFTVEIYTEPASIQDTYQTPVLGSILGVAIENLSLFLLNTGNFAGKFFGHLINPSTLFGFYKGKIQVHPFYDGQKSGAFLRATF